MTEVMPVVETTGPTAPPADVQDDPNKSDVVVNPGGQNEGEPTELLAGKFKTPEDLAKAYKELESKLGSPKEETEAKQEAQGDKDQTDTDPIFSEKTDEDVSWEKETYGEAVAEIIGKAGINASKLAEVYAEKGELPDKAYEALESQGFNRDVVDQYLNGGEKTAASTVGDIVNSVGGEQEYAAMQQWMAASLPPDQLAKFNATVDSGDLNAIQYAVEAVNAKYRQSVGVEPDLINSGRADEIVDKFNSTAELVAARKDPRYETDPAYRAEVRRKLQNSDVINAR